MLLLLLLILGTSAIPDSCERETAGCSLLGTSANFISMEDSGDDAMCQMHVLVDKLIRGVLVPGNIDLDAKGALVIVVSF